MTGGKYSMQLC